MTTKKQATAEELNEIFIKACENQQNGLLEEARSGYQQLLELFSDAPMLHYNLGLVYFEQKDFSKAVETFANGVKVAPEDKDLLFNLALSRKKNGDLQGAIGDYEALLEKEPDDIDSWYNLAGCYKDCNNPQAAIDAYGRVLLLSPEHTAANSNIAYMYQLTGDTKKAVHHYSKVVETSPDHQAAHMLAALKGEEVDSAPDNYVEAVFDEYADRYEESLLDKLEYRVPKSIREIVGANPKFKQSYQRGLDLGCGTGLGAASFSDIVEKFDGVDLSEKMIRQAEEKNLYDNLFAGTIDDYLKEVTAIYDFFLAADVFMYLGDLQTTLQLLRRCASRDALGCFSTETCEGEGFILGPTGRFKHSAEYMYRVARDTGWTVIHQQSSDLRKEKGVWVRGDLWFFGMQNN